MKKNVASQVIGAQMVSATDGSAFTGSVTVAVTGDGGTQATGSVGSGACTHEGNGFHTYAPAQAETNYDHVAFTFTGSGAVPVTVQVYTNFPQTGDGFARLGAPAGASLAADAAAIKTDTAAVKVQTDKLTFTVTNQVDSNVTNWKGSTAPAMTGDAFARLGAPAGASTAADIAAAKVDTAAIKNKTDNLPSDPADASVVAGLIAALEAKVDIVDTVADGIKTKTDNLPSDPADQSLIIAATNAILAVLGTPAGASLAADLAALIADLADEEAIAAAIWAYLVADATATGSLGEKLATGRVKADTTHMNGHALTGDGSVATPFNSVEL